MRNTFPLFAQSGASLWNKMANLPCPRPYLLVFLNRFLLTLAFEVCVLHIHKIPVNCTCVFCKKSFKPHPYVLFYWKNGSDGLWAPGQKCYLAWKRFPCPTCGMVGGTRTTKGKSDKMWIWKKERIFFSPKIPLFQFPIVKADFSFPLQNLSYHFFVPNSKVSNLFSTRSSCNGEGKKKRFENRFW